MVFSNNGPVEGVSHSSLVGVLFIHDTTIAQSVIAEFLTFMGWLYLVLFTVGDHNEEIENHALVISLGHQQVLWPSAAAEFSAVIIQVITMEQLFECVGRRDGDAGVGGASYNGVLSGAQVNVEFVHFNVQPSLFIQSECVSKYIVFGSQEKSDCSLLLFAAVVVD